MPPGVPCIRVPSARIALADLSARLYESPPAHLTLIGFTGLYFVLGVLFLFLVGREIAHGPAPLGGIGSSHEPPPAGGFHG